MIADIVIGAQWGDEGKGKIIDAFTGYYDYVVRFHGGSNAGHTIVVKNQHIVLRIVPSGILDPTTTCILARGTLIDPEVLLQEIHNLAKYAPNIQNRLYIDSECDLITPGHKLLDNLYEHNRYGNAIGTTGNGIGPAYEDRAGRRSVRIGQYFKNENDGMKAIQSLCNHHKYIIQGYNQVNHVQNLNFSSALMQKFFASLNQLKYYIRPINYQHTFCNKKVLFEGAQGSFLDLYQGTYPFVTAASTLASSVPMATGISMRNIRHIYAIFKAYVTRVGQGPLPTHADQDIAQYLRKTGKEYGSITERPRQCGWIDLPALRHAIYANGADIGCLTKLDILDGLKKIAVCIGYSYQGKLSQEFPFNHEQAWTAEYKIFDGWMSCTQSIQCWNNLPGKAKDYIKFIEKNIGIPIRYISTGPNRTDMIDRQLA